MRRGCGVFEQKLLPRGVVEGLRVEAPPQPFRWGLRPPGPIHRLERDHKINWKSLPPKNRFACGALLRSSDLERNP